MTPDPTIWREYGEPLVTATADGPLRGETVAVKDLFAVAGHRVGAGNPARLEHAPFEPAHADAVGRLLAAGADVAGIARTDEFAYSLAGTNHHYGTPPNGAAPGRISGGSSSGSAAAVSLGQASIGLGTDTGGSVRVPAAYQGLFGIRTTHDAVSRGGLLPLAPTFDAVGWLAREAALLRAVGEVLLPAGSPGGGELVVVVPALLRLADPDVAAAVSAWLPGDAEPRAWPLEELPAWREAFVTLQAWEAWQAHGAWLGDRLGTLGHDVRGRFASAREVTAEAADAARATVARGRRTIRDLVGDAVLALPAAPTVPPALGDGLAERLQQVRTATLALTCVAGIGGLPAVTIPLRTAAGLPCGVCLVAGAGRDRDLLDLAVRLTTEA